MLPDHNTDSVLDANTHCVLPLRENQSVGKMGKTSDFWRRLERARDRRGLSMDQKAIAKELRVYQSAVTKWKTGLSLPTLAKAIKLAIDAGVCVDWLLTGRQPEFPGGVADPEMGKLLEVWPDLSGELKRGVVAYAAFSRTGVLLLPPARETTQIGPEHQ
jgi:transcriptional regulator with XRE-family HTH domain